MRLFRENIKFLFIIIVIFVFTASVIYFGGAQLLESELAIQHEHVDSQLLSAKEIVEIYHSDFKNDLLFLQTFPGIKDYIEGDLRSPVYIDEVKEIFYSFAKSHSDYYQIRIIDTTGYERVRIDNKRDSTTMVVPDPELHMGSRLGYALAESLEVRQRPAKAVRPKVNAQ